MDIRKLLRELRPNAVWQILWGVFGPAVLTILTAIIQKMRAVPLDWWVLGTVFVGSLILFVYADRRRWGETSLRKMEGSLPLLESEAHIRSGRTVVVVLVSVMFGFGLRYVFFPPQLTQHATKETVPSPPSALPSDMQMQKLLREDFLSLPRPCQFKVTAPPEHKSVRLLLLNALRESYIQQNTLSGTLSQPNLSKAFTILPVIIHEDDRDTRPEKYPDQMTYAPRGIVIVSGAPANQGTIDFLVVMFEARFGWTVRAEGNLPPGSPEDFIHVQIGPGPLRNSQ